MSTIFSYQIFSDDLIFINGRRFPETNQYRVDIKDITLSSSDLVASNLIPQGVEHELSLPSL
jgi:hypothetical protein